MSLFIHAKHAAADGHPSCRIMIQFPGTEVFLLGCNALCQPWLWRTLDQNCTRCDSHISRQNVQSPTSDSTSALSGIGKKKAWDALMSSKVHQESLGLVVTHGGVCKVTMAKCEAREERLQLTNSVIFSSVRRSRRMIGSRPPRTVYGITWNVQIVKLCCVEALFRSDARTSFARQHRLGTTMERAELSQCLWWRILRQAYC